MGEFWDFIETLPNLETRAAYFRRHAPAPYTWADFVHGVLFPSEDRFPEPVVAISKLTESGFSDLIASDIAYRTWLAQQRDVVYPWEFVDNPISAARRWTRDFAFWSRQMVTTIGVRDQNLCQIATPEEWQDCDQAFWMGSLENLRLNEGLLSLAQMLCAGRVIPPWKLGLSISDFEDTFSNEMGFVDAFRLWGMEYFDDRFQLGSYLKENDAPEVWESWCRARFFVP